jgi:hypothetical protein
MMIILNRLVFGGLLTILLVGAAMLIALLWVGRRFGKG